VIFKFPKLLKKKFLKHSYNFETLVPFKVLFQWLDAAISAPLPLLETMSEIFKGNAVKGSQRFSLNLCNVSKTPSFRLKTKWWLCPPPLYSSYNNSWKFFCPWDESGFEKESLCWRCKGSTRIAGGPWLHFSWRF
jgi:hypothetical protein